MPNNYHNLVLSIRHVIVKSKVENEKFTCEKCMKSCSNDHVVRRPSAETILYNTVVQSVIPIASHFNSILLL